MKPEQNYMEGGDGFFDTIKKKIRKNKTNSTSLKINTSLKNIYGYYLLNKEMIQFYIPTIKKRRVDNYSNQNKSNIINKECKPIIINPNTKQESKDNLIGIMHTIKQNYSSGRLRHSQIRIFPFCNEKTKGGPLSSLNEVNKAEIDKRIPLSLAKIFNTSFIFQKDISQSKTHYKSPPSDVNKFIIYIKEFIKYNRKNLFLISHGSFLTSLIKKITNVSEVKLDNLDIVHLVIESKNNKMLIKALFVSRFQHNYAKKDMTYNKIHNKIDYTNKDIYHIFLMRHCVACHNLDTSVSGLYYKARNPRAGKYALCIKETINELRGKKDAIQNYVKNFVIDFSKIFFGSSIIFRAMLTAVLVKQEVFSNVNNSINNKLKNDIFSIEPTSETQAIPVEGVVVGVVETGTQRNTNTVYTATPNNRFLNTRGDPIISEALNGGLKKVKKKKTIKKVVVKKKVPVKITKCMTECRKCIIKCTKLCNSNKNKVKMKDCVKQCKCCINLCKTMIELCKCDPSGEMCKKMAKLCAICCKKCMVECNKHKDDKLCKQVSLSCKTCLNACMKCC